MAPLIGYILLELVPEQASFLRAPACHVPIGGAR